MKDYEKRLNMSWENVEKFIYNIDELSHGDGVELVPGALFDNFFLDVGDAKLKAGRVKIRRYNCFVETYLNEWSSCYTWISTDNEQKFMNRLNLERESYSECQGVPVEECEGLQLIY